MSETILQEAQRLVYGDRQADYGHPLDDFSRTAAIWTAILGDRLKPGERVTPQEVGLCMVGVKLSRQINRPNRDNLVDGAGYFGTVALVESEVARREIAAETFGPLDENGWPVTREEDAAFREIANRKDVVPDGSPIRKQPLSDSHFLAHEASPDT